MASLATVLLFIKRYEKFDDKSEERKGKNEENERWVCYHFEELKPLRNIFNPILASFLQGTTTTFLARVMSREEAAGAEKEEEQCCGVPD